MHETRCSHHALEPISLRKIDSLSSKARIDMLTLDQQRCFVSTAFLKMHRDSAKVAPVQPTRTGTKLSLTCDPSPARQVASSRPRRGGVGRYQGCGCLHLPMFRRSPVKVVAGKDRWPQRKLCFSI